MEKIFLDLVFPFFALINMLKRLFYNRKYLLQKDLLPNIVYKKSISHITFSCKISPVESTDTMRARSKLFDLFTPSSNKVSVS